MSAAPSSTATKSATEAVKRAATRTPKSPASQPTQTAAQLNAATAAARIAQATASNANPTAAPVTGDNGKGHAPKSVAAKPATKPATSGKSSKAQSDKAAKAFKLTPAATATAASKLGPKREVAVALIAAGAKLAQTLKVEGMTADEIGEQIGKWLAYLPATPSWPTEVLGPRSDAGRRPTKSA